MDDFNPFRTMGLVMFAWFAIVGTVGIGTLVTIFYLLNKLIEKM